ncbi:Permease [Giardia duodenalis]|uniref:Permease n=1 Tax=Giardia intestinalis TaxID=5741 RepID=V6U6I7_GIAIN|nr:Permease [Giardia intestinalis]
MEWKVMEGLVPANSGSTRPSDIINESGVQSGYATCLSIEHAAIQKKKIRYYILFV